jgi:hypothetical protein
MLGYEDILWAIINRRRVAHKMLVVSEKDRLTKYFQAAQLPS